MKDFDVQKIKDPEYFREGRLDAHSDHRFTPDVDGEKSFFMDLNGVWKFHYAKNFALTIPGFEQENFSCRDWEDIHVPAHMQMEGYGVPQYVNKQYPWEGHEQLVPGEIPEHFNPVGSYVRTFTLPEEMRGKRLFITFDGAESALALWLNGQYIGYSGDSFTPSEFELTGAVKDGENKLAVQVFTWTSGSWCEDQDFFRFSGIHRDVFLYVIPDVHVRDLRVDAVVAEDLRAAELSVHMESWGEGSAEICLKKDGQVIFTESTDLHAATADKATAADTANETAAYPQTPQYNYTCTHELQQPVLWSAEDPQLYELEICVFDKNHALQEVIREPVGFRRFELVDHVMRLNGKRIVFKGVNRHEFSSLNGRVVSEEELRQDLTTMKRNNINAIRTCHYPNVSLLYRLCDEYGLYVIDETNLETHGTWDCLGETHDLNGVIPKDKPEWLPVILDRGNAMVQRDKNHPCILIWSCGNESFGGKDIYLLSELFRRQKDGRLVHYEGVNWDRSYEASSDIESQMYTPVAQIREFLEKHREKPFICCEYTHAMGNSCGAMHKYTDLTDEEPLYQGGFIWDYIDQTIEKKDRYGQPFQAFGGDFDDRPCDYNFSGNGIVYGEGRLPSPKMQEVRYNYQNITAEVAGDLVTIRNKNLFVNTDTFRCLVTIARDGKVIGQEELKTAVAPLCQETYGLPPADSYLPGEYTVTVSFHTKNNTLWAPAGHEVAFGQGVYIVGERKVPNRNLLQTGSPTAFVPACADWNSVRVVRSLHILGVSGEHFEVLFSLYDGGLVSYKYAGRELLQAIPKPNFWRAPIDNDFGSLMQQRYGQWKIASLYATHMDWKKSIDKRLLFPEITEGEDHVTITFMYLLPMSVTAKCRLSYEVYADGRVKTTLSYKPENGLIDMPEFGVLFKMDADYDRLTWYGLGPEETYWDRKHGAKLGIYRNSVSDNMAKYIVPQECGAKQEVRDAAVTDKRGRGLRFFMDPQQGPFVFSALPYTPHELENARHPFELPPVHYTVVRVALQQMGVGGDDSWMSETHPEYLLDIHEELHFSFVFQGI